MASRTYDIIFRCGCMMSLDGGGGLIECGKKEDCQYDKVLKDGRKVTKKMIEKWMKETKRRNE